MHVHVAHTVSDPYGVDPFQCNIHSRVKSLFFLDDDQQSSLDIGVDLNKYEDDYNKVRIDYSSILSFIGDRLIDRQHLVYTYPQ